MSNISTSLHRCRRRLQPIRRRLRWEVIIFLQHCRYILTKSPSAPECNRVALKGLQFPNLAYIFNGMTGMSKDFAMAREHFPFQGCLIIMVSLTSSGCSFTCTKIVTCKKTFHPTATFFKMKVFGGVCLRVPACGQRVYWHLRPQARPTVQQHSCTVAFEDRTAHWSLWSTLE